MREAIPSSLMKYQVIASNGHSDPQSCPQRLGYGLNLENCARKKKLPNVPKIDATDVYYTLWQTIFSGQALRSVMEDASYEDYLCSLKGIALGCAAKLKSQYWEVLENCLDPRWAEELAIECQHLEKSQLLRLLERDRRSLTFGSLS